MPAPPTDISLAAVDLAKLEQIAAALAPTLALGDVIVLEGPLAAGKTQFVQYLAAALQIEDTAVSPTFTLANFYRGSGAPMLHVDAYRIETAEELADLTLDDFFDDHISVIEWGARFADMLPAHLSIRLTPEVSGDRQMEIAAADPTWQARLPAIRKALEAVS